MVDRISRMASERVREEGGTPRWIQLTAAAPTANINAQDKVVVVNTTGGMSDGVAIVTLPPAAEAVGKTIAIIAPRGATDGDVSLYVHETGAELGTYGDLDADGDIVVLFCTGLGWVPLYSSL